MLETFFRVVIAKPHHLLHLVSYWTSLADIGNGFHYDEIFATIVWLVVELGLKLGISAVISFFITRKNAKVDLVVDLISS